jgi:hypothetical protein
MLFCLHSKKGLTQKHILSILIRALERVKVHSLKPREQTLFLWVHSRQRPSGTTVTWGPSQRASPTGLHALRQEGILLFRPYLNLRSFPQKMGGALANVNIETAISVQKEWTAITPEGWPKRTPVHWSKPCFLICCTVPGPTQEAWVHCKTVLKPSRWVQQSFTAFLSLTPVPNPLFDAIS